MPFFIKEMRFSIGSLPSAADSGPKLAVNPNTAIARKPIVKNFTNSLIPVASLASSRVDPYEYRKPEQARRNYRIEPPGA